MEIEYLGLAELDRGAAFSPLRRIGRLAILLLLRLRLRWGSAVDMPKVQGDKSG